MVRRSPTQTLSWSYLRLLRFKEAFPLITLPCREPSQIKVEPKVVFLGAAVLFVVTHTIWRRWAAKNEAGKLDSAAATNSNDPKALMTDHNILTPEQVETFLRDGVVVIPGAITPEEVATAQEGLHAHLFAAAGVDVKDLEGTASGLRQLSSTNG